MDKKFDETMKFNIQINQIIGYILSGDPTYITSYNDARSMIIQMERDELLEAILVDYLK